jgi:ATP-dependent Clp endopeptidase proteolytic subunit ClpP
MNLIQTENKAGKVKLTDAIMPWSVEKLTEDISKLFGAKAAAEGADFGAITNCAENAVDTLEIEINSPGGSIFDGYNIYQEIMSLRDRGVIVTATVTGMAASMASVICMSCDIVRMVPHARMMIHDASQAVQGNAEKLRKAADLLDGLSADIAQTYVNRTGKPLDEIRAMMKVETWMTAKQAVELGFANEVFDIRGALAKPCAWLRFQTHALSMGYRRRGCIHPPVSSVPLRSAPRKRKLDSRLPMSPIHSAPSSRDLAMSSQST